MYRISTASLMNKKIFNKKGIKILKEACIICPYSHDKIANPCSNFGRIFPKKDKKNDPNWLHKSD